MTTSTLSLTALTAACMVLMAAGARAQTGGDQIVDGIGETSLIARYPLDGSLTDRSRNALAATVSGDGVSFVENRRFGKVLALPGTPEGFVLLPAKALEHVESLSIVGWVRLRPSETESTFFEFGSPAGRRFVAKLAGDGGFRVGFVKADNTFDPATTAAAVGVDRWAHVAVVFDAAERTVTAYQDGKQIAKSKPVDGGLDGLAAAAVLKMGGGLNGFVRDVRLYSVPLSDAQVTTIHGNGLPGNRNGPTTAPQVRPPTGPVVIDFGGPKLVAVPDIAAVTPVGQLPKLPATVVGKYENDASGPPVRVIWPSPKSPADVQKPGNYTVKGTVPGTTLSATAVVTVTPAAASIAGPTRALHSFPLGHVTLDKDSAGHDTLFVKNRNKFVRGLSMTNPDDFLYMFRDAFGQPQPAGAKPLGVWDNQTTRLRGHATGHYLSALAQAYASATYAPTLREQFLGKMNYTIDTLYDLSHKSGTPREPNGSFNADPTKVPPGAGRKGFDSDLRQGHVRTDYENWGRGFISAYPPDQFIMLEQGSTYGTGDDQIWAPYYTLHKIIAGLLDCYEVGGNEKALDVARGMGLWCYERLRVLPTETRVKMWNRYIAGEYGGMNEALARLGRLSGDKRFLEAAKLFDNLDFFYGGPGGVAGLSGNVDTLRGKHANQHIPQIIGALETYADTAEPVYFRIADNFWDITTTAYAYSIGGVAGASQPNNAECFTAEPNTLGVNGFSEGGQNETCATYNMLKLSRGLFMFEPQQAKYMDYYERAIVNDILASVAEHNPGNTYHIPLNAGARKSFGNEEMDGFTCCNGTALESNTKLQDTIYLKGKDDASLFVNLFVPSTLNWAEKKATLKQATRFPYADSTTFTITGLNGVDLRVRVPAWATNGYTVKVNGQAKAIDAKPGTYLSLGREWKDGDVIEVTMPFAFRLERVMDRPNLASVCYGPVVLAAEEAAPRSDWRQVTLDTADLSKSITGDPSSLRFKLGELTLKPFFETYGRYSVYFDVKAKR